GAYVFQQLLRPEDDDEGGGSREGSPRGEIVNHGTGSSPSELSTLFYQLNGAFTAAHAGIGASKPNSALTAESSGSSPALTSRTIQADVKPPNQPHIVMAGRTAMTVKASDHLFAQFAGEQD